MISSNKNKENNKINIENVNNTNINKNMISNENLEELLCTLYNSIYSEDLKKKMESIINIHDIIYSNYSLNKNIIINNVNIIIDSLINSIKEYFNIISKDIISLKYLTNTFYLICNIKDLLSRLSFEIEEKLIVLIFYIVLFKDLKEMGKSKEGLIIWKSFNAIMLRILNVCIPTNTIIILMRQIINNKEKNQKFIEYCSRCLEIITNKMNNIVNKLNVPEIFFEINKFYVNYNINIEKIKEKKSGEFILFSRIKKIIISILEIKKEKIYEDYKMFINSKINGKDGIPEKNIIKSIIDNSLSELK